jgi:hypothetical protein
VAVCKKKITKREEEERRRSGGGRRSEEKRVKGRLCTGTDTFGSSLEESKSRRIQSRLLQDACSRGVSKDAYSWCFGG